MKKILEKLLLPVGPAGSETPVADAITELIKDHVDELYTDVMGNLIAVKNGKKGGKRVMLSSHMDHIGYIVTDIEKEGYLRVMTLGGVGITKENRHIVFTNGVQGVLCAQPIKAGETLEARHMFVDIGATDREDAMKKVNIGDSAVCPCNIVELGEYRIAAPAMDDRCACALQAAALMKMGKPKNTIVAVFSVQEEVGCRGAKVAAYNAEAQIGLALDVTGWGDTPETVLPSIKLGEGAAVKIMDRGSISSPLIREVLIACAEKTGAAYQREVLPFGGTDASAMQAARGSMYAGTLSIPCRYVHSALEVIDMRDMESALKILLAFCDYAF